MPVLPINENIPRESAVSAFRISPPPLLVQQNPITTISAPGCSVFMLFQPIADRGHQFHRRNSPVTARCAKSSPKMNTEDL
uniref:Uncharacterized protein n=1 Tax=Knipowitschia caucasica TaxID=637954 RepID=A0AAV2KVT0_KNICA